MRCHLQLTRNHLNFARTVNIFRKLTICLIFMTISTHRKKNEKKITIIIKISICVNAFLFISTGILFAQRLKIRKSFNRSAYENSLNIQKSLTQKISIKMSYISNYIMMVFQFRQMILQQLKSLISCPICLPLPPIIPNSPVISILGPLAKMEFCHKRRRRDKRIFYFYVNQDKKRIRGMSDNSYNAFFFFFTAVNKFIQKYQFYYCAKLLVS